MTGFIYLFGTIALTVFGQLVVKWKVSEAGEIPVDWPAKLAFFGRLLADPWILASLASAFLAFLCWVGTLSKLDLTYAYPFMSLSFVLVLVLGRMLFAEPVTPQKVVGMVLIVLGIVVTGRSG